MDVEQAWHNALLVHQVSTSHHVLHTVARLQWVLQEGCKNTCMATAVEESASPPPSTIEAGPLQPVTAITVYATTASVATTCTHGTGPRQLWQPQTCTTAIAQGAVTLQA